MKTSVLLSVIRGLLLTLVAVSLGAWAYRTWMEDAPPVGRPVHPSPPGVTGSGLVAINFHGATRCRSCRMIGEQSRRVVEAGRRDGWLPADTEWQEIDFDEPSNQHWVNDYHLTSSTVVILRREAGQVVKWERLDGVWDHSRDPAALSNYLGREITRFAGNTRP